jgi:signal transduction histidine kinase/CheY-like chemotaxis protein
MKDNQKVSPDRMHIPILLPTGRDADLVSKMLDKEMIDLAVCSSFNDLLEEIQKGCGPFILGDEALSGNNIERLMKNLDEQPEWSDLPAIIFLGSNPEWKLLNQLVERRSMPLIQRPVKKTMLIIMVRAALELRRRQYQIRDLLQDLRETNDQLGSRTLLLQQLALELTMSEERERRRIAQILHDDLQQILVSAKIQTELLTENLKGENAQEVQNIYATLAKAMDTTRALSHELNPAFLYGYNLGSALKQIFSTMGENYGLRVESTIELEDVKVTDGIKIFVCRTVQELFLNCAKYSGSDRISLKVSGRHNFLTVSAADDGAGFDPENLKIRGGMEGGFGLFSIQERAKALGGSFQVESSPNKGSRFSIKIPCKTEIYKDNVKLNFPDMLDIASSGNILKNSSREKTEIRIIIADDHTVMRRGLASLLQNQPDIQVVAEASDGQEAVDLALKFRPDVVLMDVSMPVLNGVEATRRIKAEAPEIVVIGLSMHSSEEVRKSMAEAGSDEYLQKDRPANELISSIKKNVYFH